jgi:PAS domain S-box-containing protein
VYGSDGQPVALEGFISDITQRKRDADALRVSEERFRLLARVTSDAIYDWDITDDTVWWGEGAELLFGLRREQLGDVLGSWSDRIHPEDRDPLMEDLHRAVEADVETFMAEYRFQRGDGSYANMLDRGHIIRDADGRAVRMIGGVSDLTERKHLETQLARRLTEEYPATRVLFMSGYTDDAIVRHGVSAGKSRFLEKPFTVAELTSAVRAALSDYRRGTGAPRLRDARSRIDVG